MKERGGEGKERNAHIERIIGKRERDRETGKEETDMDMKKHTRPKRKRFRDRSEEINRAIGLDKVSSPGRYRLPVGDFDCWLGDEQLNRKWRPIGNSGGRYRMFVIKTVFQHIRHETKIFNGDM